MATRPANRLALHDFKKDGLTKTQLAQFLEQLGWESLLIRNSSSGRQLDASQRLKINATKAIDWLLKIATLIKQPVLA